MAAIQDGYAGSSPGLLGPSDDWVQITPSDSADLARKPKAIYIGHNGTDGPVEGNIVMRDKNGNNATFRVAPGVTLYLRPHRILSTGTTADMVIIAAY
jgi:hypothetical protein